MLLLDLENTDDHVAEADPEGLMGATGGGGTGHLFLELLGVRFEGLRRPKTHGTLARVQRSQAPDPVGTEHLSFWVRHRSHDKLWDGEELSPPPAPGGRWEPGEEVEVG
jgi:hypothetical protein